MDNRIQLNLNGEYYRGNQLSPGAIEPQSMGESTMTPQGLAAIHGKGAEKETISKEREEELDVLMNDVKAFIRRIDVKSL